MDNSQFPVARKSGLVVQEMPDEVLVYDLNTNKAHCLNQTAAKIWMASDGKTSVSQIAANLGKGGNEDLVWLAIDQLNETNLLESKVASPFGTQSRRDVIKKIGLASLVALPVIASLVAPQNALAAQSCNCVNNSNCASQPSCPTHCCNSVSSICNAPQNNPGVPITPSNPFGCL
jgi:hypothetical protein